jgi:hypothetical protein
MGYLNRRRVAALGAAALALVAIPTTINLAPSHAGTFGSHVIKVRPRPYMNNNWKVDGVLYDSNGNKVYSWSEDHPAGKGHVEWNYRAGDGDWIDLWFHTDATNNIHKRVEGGESHCYLVFDPEPLNSDQEKRDGVITENC